MIVTQQRLFENAEVNAEETISILHINSVFQCFTLEDEYRAVKVYGETRIDAGDYQVELLREGNHHYRYNLKFPRIHKGMIHFLHVPKFTGILYHILNYDTETSGCIGPGEYPMPYWKNGVKRWKIVNSTVAYLQTYPIIANALENKETVIWQIRD